MSTLEAVIDQFTTYIRRTESAQQIAATSQALSLFADTLSDHLQIPVNKLTTSHLGVGGFHHYLSWLQSHRSAETEHLYSRATLRFLTYASKHHNLELPIDDIITYLTDNRRTKSHEIQPPPLSLLNKIVHFAKVSPVRDETSSDRDTLRFLRDRAFILTLAACGNKLSELCDLRVSGIESLIAISVYGSSTYSGALEAYLSRRHFLDLQQVYSSFDLPVFARHDKRSSDKVLPISRWTAANIINQWVAVALTKDDHDLLEKRQYVITSQSFRDAFILNRLHQTQDIRAVMEAAGHADETTTRRYLAILDRVAIDLETNK